MLDRERERNERKFWKFKSLEKWYLKIDELKDDSITFDWLKFRTEKFCLFIFKLLGRNACVLRFIR